MCLSIRPKMKELTDVDGLTAEVWGKELFECEYCAECGKDYDEHDYVLFLGHWFARCRSSEIDTG